MYGKIVTSSELAGRLRLLKDTGHRIIFTNGCFDILHYGHIAYLANARSLGDKLVVGVNDDESVRRLKGNGRPVNTLADRMSMLSALQSTDFVVPFAEDTPENLIRSLRPHVLVKGGDYAAEQVVGGDFIRTIGGEVVILPFEQGYSSTSLIHRIRKLDP